MNVGSSWVQIFFGLVGILLFFAQTGKGHLEFLNTFDESSHSERAESHGLVAKLSPM